MRHGRSHGPRPPRGVTDQPPQVVGTVVDVGLRGEVLGQQEGHHAQQLLGRQGGRVHRGRPELRGRPGPHELEVGSAASGRAGAQHPLDEGRRDGPALVDPAQQLQLLGSGQER